MNKRIILNIIAFLAILFQVNIVLALEYDNLNALPKFCNYVMGQKYGHPKSEKYREIVGPCWTHMHHYCKGLDNINTALLSFSNQSLRDHKFGNAIIEFDYVIKRSTSRCKLLPEVILRKGQVLFYLQNNQQALKILYQAIRTFRDYVPAYIALSNYFISQGDLKKARHVIQIGLKYSPDSKKLKKSLAAIGN